MDNDSKQPSYDWHIYLKRELQQPIAIVAAQKNVQIREYVSEVLEEALAKEPVLKGI